MKDDRIDAAGEYVAGIINGQLIPAILALNYGDAEQAPTVRFLEEEEGDLTEAQRDQTLAAAGLKIGQDFLYKKYGIPKPADDEETIGGTGRKPNAQSRKPKAQCPGSRAGRGADPAGEPFGH